MASQNSRYYRHYGYYNSNRCSFSPRGPVAVDLDVGPVDKDGVPAVVEGGSGEAAAGLVVNTFSVTTQCNTVEAGETEMDKEY